MSDINKVKYTDVEIEALNNVLVTLYKLACMNAYTYSEMYREVKAKKDAGLPVKVTTCMRGDKQVELLLVDTARVVAKGKDTTINLLGREIPLPNYTYKCDLEIEMMMWDENNLNYSVYNAADRDAKIE